MVSRSSLFFALLAAASPAASQTTPRQIAEVADISGLTASPDGRWVAYRIERPSTLTNRIDVDWYLAPTDGAAQPLHLGRTGTAMWNDAGSILPGEAKWAPDSRSLIVRALIDGRIALWESSIDGSGFRPIVAGDGDIEAFEIISDGMLVASEGPARAAIADAEERERDNGILVDSRTDLTQPLYRGASINGRLSTQRFSGGWFDRVPLLADAPRQTRAHNFRTGAVRPATEIEKRALETPAITEMPQSLRTALVIQKVCFDDTGCPDQAPILSSRIALKDGRILVTLRDHANRQRLLLWSPATAGLHALAASDGLLSGGRSESRPCAAGHSAVYCVEAAADIPPRLVRVDLDGRKTLIDSPNSFPDSDGLLAETIAWQVGGSRASGVLIRPKIPGRLPLFLTYYRCSGYLRGGTGDEWPLRALAANGVAALCINALPGGGTADERYDIGLLAVKAAISHLADRGLVDPQRVGMGGLSFGSEVTMWTAMNSDLLKAVSIASVQIEPIYYWFNARPGREIFAKNIRQNWKLGDPEIEPEGWRRISAALNTRRILSPVLMQLPESEARQSVELQSKLATAHMGEMYIFPFAPHLKVEPRQKLAAYERNLDWFLFWLKGEIDPDPAKSLQYQRWSTLGAAKGGTEAARAQRSTSAISSKRK